MSPKRAAIRELVEEIPDHEIPAAKRYLEYLRDEGDPLLKLLANAPIDDEPSSPEEDESCRQAWEECQRGEYTTAEDLKRELLD